ncbi:MAG: sigma-54 dependent transcriptional regulator [Geminicoccaceae bacterium]
MSLGILIVEDEASLARNIATFLGRNGYTARVAGTGKAAREAMGEFAPDLVLLDLRLPDCSGLDLMAELRAADPTLRVVIMTAYASVQTAVDAMKAGAVDYVGKPLVLGELKLLIDRILESERTATALAYHERRTAAGGVDAIVGDSPAIRELRGQIRRLLDAEAVGGVTAPAVLVTGETGSGKELVARALHESSVRAGRPFVELNCTTLPMNLVEDELFGHERGAFTDAKEKRVGLVEAADGGTLFLDEIGDLDPQVQVKLLRLLEERTLRRLGGLRERPVDVRIVAATHRPLESLVREGRFRADLYFRLRVVELTVPPLRQRGDDILLLARRFLERSVQRYRRAGLSFAPEAERALLAHSWPGNVRELRNVMEQAALMARGDRVTVEDLALSSLGSGVEPAAPEEGDGLVLSEVEQRLLREALARSGGNVTAAAKLLGVTRDTVRYRLQKYGLQRG